MVYIPSYIYDDVMTFEVVATEYFHLPFNLFMERERWKWQMSLYWRKDVTKPNNEAASGDTWVTVGDHLKRM